MCQAVLSWAVSRGAPAQMRSSRLSWRAPRPDLHHSGQPEDQRRGPRRRPGGRACGEHHDDHAGRSRRNPGRRAPVLPHQRPRQRRHADPPEIAGMRAAGPAANHSSIGGGLPGQRDLRVHPRRPGERRSNHHRPATGCPPRVTLRISPSPLAPAPAADRRFPRRDRGRTRATEVSSRPRRLPGRRRHRRPELAPMRFLDGRCPSVETSQKSGIVLREPPSCRPYECLLSAISDGRADREARPLVV